jgi:hypothetical protein
LTTFPFIVGCPRSGTTLLRSMLDAHPNMAVPNESYFIVGMAHERSRFDRRPFPVEDFLEYLLSHPRFQRWGMRNEPLRRRTVQAAPQSLAEAIRVIYRLYAAERGKSRYGDKTPDYVLNIPLLADLFPDARFIHLIRDGRDVALSLRDARFGPKTMGDIALMWKHRVESGRKTGNAVGPHRYLEVSYEALVSDPRSVLDTLCSFIALPFEPSMLEYFQREDLFSGIRYREQHRHLAQPPRSNLRDWRTEMSKDDLALFEALAGQTLVDHGYECAYGALPLRSRVAAGRVIVKHGCLRARRALARGR